MWWLLLLFHVGMAFEGHTWTDQGVFKTPFTTLDLTNSTFQNISTTSLGKIEVMGISLGYWTRYVWITDFNNTNYYENMGSIRWRMNATIMNSTSSSSSVDWLLSPLQLIFRGNHTELKNPSLPSVRFIWIPPPWNVTIISRHAQSLVDTVSIPAIGNSVWKSAFEFSRDYPNVTRWPIEDFLGIGLAVSFRSSSTTTKATAHMILDELEWLPPPPPPPPMITTASTPTPTPAIKEEEEEGFTTSFTTTGDGSSSSGVAEGGGQLDSTSWTISPSPLPLVSSSTTEMMSLFIILMMVGLVCLFIAVVLGMIFWKLRKTLQRPVKITMEMHSVPPMYQMPPPLPDYPPPALPFRSTLQNQQEKPKSSPYITITEIHDALPEDMKMRLRMQPQVSGYFTEPEDSERKGGSMTRRSTSSTMRK